MNTIASLLTLDSVALDLDLSSRKRVFEEAALLLEKNIGISHQAVFDALNARERLGSTCIGGSVAIPHGRIDGIEEMSVAILRTRTSIEMGSIDNRMARLFFVIAIPQDDAEKYLDVLRQIATMLQDRSFKDQLLNAQTSMEMCQLIGGWNPPESSDKRDHLSSDEN